MALFSQIHFPINASLSGTRRGDRPFTVVKGKLRRDNVEREGQRPRRARNLKVYKELSKVLEHLKSS